MARQNDLRLEAKHLLKFRQLFADRPNIIFPEPIPGYIYENALIEVKSDSNTVSILWRLMRRVSQSQVT